jgi:hypothetical protein
MPKAATVLKVFYPNLIQFTCLAHGLQSVAKEVRAKFPQVNKLILMKKKCFRNPRMKYNPISNTSQMHPCPPHQMGTWIEAVDFYSEHFEAVKSIVAKSPSESAVSVHESQSAFNDPNVACSTAYIQSNLGWLPESIKRLQTKGLPLQELRT